MPFVDIHIAKYSLKVIEFVSTPQLDRTISRITFRTVGKIILLLMYSSIVQLFKLTGML